MVYDETLINYPDWKITFTVHIGASDKQLGSDISYNKKSIALLSIILINTQCNYTTLEKKFHLILERLKQFRVFFCL